MSVLNIVILIPMLACFSADLISAGNAVEGLDVKQEVAPFTLFRRNRREEAVAQDSPPQPIIYLDRILKELVTGPLKSASRNRRSEVQNKLDVAIQEPQERFLLGPAAHLALSPIAKFIGVIVDKALKILGTILAFLIPKNILMKMLPKQYWNYVGVEAPKPIESHEKED